MRISVIKIDAGYKPTAHLCRIRLDGVERNDCHTADDEAGVIWCVHFEDGKPVEEELHGKVEIVPPSPLKLAQWVATMATSLLNAGQVSIEEVDRVVGLYQDELPIACAELIDALKEKK